MSRRFVLAACDISDPRRRARMRNTVSAWAHGGQKSVWECFVTPAEEPAFEQALLGNLDQTRDRLAILHPHRRGARMLGRARLAEDAPLVFIG